MQRIDHIVLLLKAYLSKSGKEKAYQAEIEALLQKYPSLEELLQELEDDDRFVDALREYEKFQVDQTNDPLLESILMRIRSEEEVQPKNKMRKLRYWFAGAAACAALVLGFWWLQPSQQHQQSHNTLTRAESILPQKNGVTLSLSDGRSLELRAEEGGIINGDQLQYADGSPLLADEILAHDAMMTLSVPRGSDYYVVLADGTKVWMNAESELRYPQTFSGTQRVVHLVGEAYFEVAKNKEKPFIVETPHERVEVLGTHFNVSSYPTDTKSAVTLVEGRVQVSVEGQVSRVLHPGQQSIVAGQDIEVQDVNIDEYIAWKNGEFMFNEESLSSAMRKIGRWYDLDISVDPALNDMHLWGSVPRTDNFGKVLKLIQLTNKEVKVEIEGRRVRFMK